MKYRKRIHCPRVLPFMPLFEKICFSGAGETRVAQLTKHKIISNVGKPKTREKGQKICEEVMITNQSFIPQSKDGSTVARWWDLNYPVIYSFALKKPQNFQTQIHKKNPNANTHLLFLIQILPRMLPISWTKTGTSIPCGISLHRLIHRIISTEYLLTS